VTGDGDAVRIAVDDDGTGIAEDERARALERFARGRDTRSDGSGLGLAIVDQQARLHGGHVDLASSALGGLRAVVTLPRRTS
jgi:signal transduction histidine kinase